MLFHSDHVTLPASCAVRQHYLKNHPFLLLWVLVSNKLLYCPPQFSAFCQNEAEVCCGHLYIYFFCFLPVFWPNPTELEDRLGMLIMVILDEVNPGELSTERK